MRKTLQFLPAVFAGILTASAAMISSSLLLRNLDSLVSLLGPMFGIKSKSLAYAAEILAQLKEANLILPWLLLAAGAAFGLLFACLIRRTKHRIITGICLYLSLLILLIPVSLWLTEVNSILAGALISRLIPLLPALL